MAGIYSVGQINAYIKNMFAQDYLLRSVSVRGEISNCKYHTSGHIYFTLKDETAAISCAVFSWRYKHIPFRLENGQQVVVQGEVSVYEKGGTYSIAVSAIRQDGLGELHARFEALKEELREMGMFDQAYKQPIPRHVRTLGVVTAPTGAAVRDIIQISKRRNPGIRILLYPAKVQGDGAAQSVVRGIGLLDQAGVDVIIIGRGGGSLEDLWAFNEEIVARAVFSCKTPIISAVGHETDIVISDFVADLRAPTPSAAAELAVEDVRQTLDQIRRYGDSLYSAMSALLNDRQEKLQRCRMLLARLSPDRQVNEQRRQLVEREERLRLLMEHILSERRNKVLLYEQKLKACSPYETLRNGYAFVTDSQGRRVCSVAGLSAGDGLSIRFEDGTARTRVEDIEPAGLEPEKGEQDR